MTARGWQIIGLCWFVVSTVASVTIMLGSMAAQAKEKAK